MIATKKNAPSAAATGTGAKAITNHVQDITTWPKGQDVYHRLIIRDTEMVRRAYITDWQQFYRGDDNYDFFLILALAYETGREMGIREERAKRRRAV